MTLETFKISNDGKEWFEVTREKMREMLDDPAVDCWVDLSSEKQVMHVTLGTIRNPRATIEKEAMEAAWYGRPTTLYGIPVVYETAEEIALASGRVKQADNTWARPEDIAYRKEHGEQYKCATCGHMWRTKYPVNGCPECGS